MRFNILGIIAWACAGSVGTPAVMAAPFDRAVALAPADAEVFIGVDHKELAKHPDREPLVALGMSRSILPTILADADACLGSGREVLRSLVFRLPGGRYGTVLEGTLNPACTKRHIKRRYEARLGTKGAGFERSHKHKKYFLFSPHKAAAFLGKGRIVLADLATVLDVLDVAAKRSKGAFKSTKLRALYAKATANRSVAWAVSIIPKRIQKRFVDAGDHAMGSVKSFYLQARGTGDVNVNVVAQTGGPTKAKSLVAVVKERMERRLRSSVLLQAIGVADMLLAQVTLAAKADDFTLKLALTQLQMAILSRYGGKILSILE